MHIILKILKGTAGFIAHFLLWLLLGVGLAALAVTSNATDREIVKSWPKDAGIYQNSISALPETLCLEEEIDPDDPSNNVCTRTMQEMIDDSGLDQDSLFTAIESVFTPEYIEKQVNIGIDALYDTLESESDELTLTIRVAKRANDLVDTLSSELVSQIKGYPTCSDKKTANFLKNGDFNPLELDCIPKGVNYEREIDRFSEGFALGEEDGPSFEDIVLTAEDTKEFNKELNTYRTVYSQAKNLPTYFLITAVLLSAILILLADSVLHGIKGIGRMFFFQGLFTAVLFYFIPWFSSIAIDDLRNQDTGEAIPEKLIDTVIEPLFNEVMADISRSGIQLGLMAACVGFILWISVYIWHKIHHEPQDAHAPKNLKKTSELDYSKKVDEEKKAKKT